MADDIAKVCIEWEGPFSGLPGPDWASRRNRGISVREWIESNREGDEYAEMLATFADRLDWRVITTNPNIVGDKVTFDVWIGPEEALPDGDAG